MTSPTIRNVLVGMRRWWNKMEKPERAIENNRSDIYECLRCHQEYCSECNDSVEIDFDLTKEIEEDELVRKEDNVCPFCYNQLLDEVFQNKKKI